MLHIVKRMVDREKRLNIRIADDEAMMLHELAEAEGVSQSDYIRLFIRRAHAERFGEKKKTKK